VQVTFKLEDFEGPLDLLLYLLEKNKMSIYDIEISSITSQYMFYLESTDTKEIEQMSEFIVMAATLLYIKSKMLLPKHEKEKEELEEDPREELVRKLIEYKKIKYVSEELNERQIESPDRYFRQIEIANELETIKPTTKDILGDITLEVLYEAFQALLKQKQVITTQKEKRIDEAILKRDSYTIEEKSTYIMNLIKLNESISFFDLCKNSMPKEEMIVSFMALLELVHKKQVKIFQEGHLEDILIMGVDESEKD
jgi:segregation and condensation protein A